MLDVMQIDFTQRYGKVIQEDVVNQKVYFVQNGIDYDGAGKACNKDQLKKHYAKVAAEAQQEANDAMAAYEKSQALADGLMAELAPDNPKTVAELTDALKVAEVEIPEGSLKADLEALWEHHQAGLAAAA